MSESPSRSDPRQSLSLKEAAAALVKSGQRLAAEGLVARSWGNLSLRLDNRTMAITPSGIPYSDLREDMIVAVDIESGEWTGSWKPSGERSLHRAIYAKRPSVQAIVHTHQNAASACAAARIGLKASWGEVPCAAYALPSTKALAKATIAALGDRQAVLLANHGAFILGTDMDEAFERAKELEVSAADLLASRHAGSLPARADQIWDNTFLSPAVLGDGSPALLSKAPFTLAWAQRSKPLTAALDDLAQLVGVRIPRLRAMPKSLPKEAAVFIVNQGLLLHGPEAEALAMVAEKDARAEILGEAFGGARKLPFLESILMHIVYKQSYSKQAKKASAKN